MELTSSTVERKASQAHQAVDAAHQAVDAAAAKALNTTAPVIDRVAQAAHQTVDRVAQAAVPTADWITHSAQQLKQQQEELVTTSRSYIRERPLVAVGLALAFGYLVGRIWR